jgi:hypothetical protein
MDTGLKLFGRSEKTESSNSEQGVRNTLSPKRTIHRRHLIKLSRDLASEYKRTCSFFFLRSPDKGEVVMFRRTLYDKRTAGSLPRERGGVVITSHAERREIESGFFPNGFFLATGW